VKFWLGLAIGVVLGVAGTYLAREQPWRSAAPIAVAPEPIPAATDAGVAAKKKGHRRGGGGHAGSGGGGAVEPYEVDDEIQLTAADRALEWRGDPVALPPARVDLGAAGEARPLDDGEIQSGVAGGSAPMIGCIKDAVGGAPLSAEVTLQLLVGGDGRVQKLRVQAPTYLHEHGLLACARRAARGFPFAATGAPTIVTAPFHLN
jgi:hypothetical protein